MKLVNAGKTKNVYVLADGSFLLEFKDDVTGVDGVFDPGANQVGLTIKGAGQAGLRLSKHFFELLKAKGIPTHYLSADLDRGTMQVKPGEVFGKGIEVICRFRAVGSFLRRYGAYVTEGQPLDALVEVTIKDDARQDPLINPDALEMLGILSPGEYEVLKGLTQKISRMIKEELASKGLELYDIKLEFGRDEAGQIMLIDEISGGNMRVYKEGAFVDPIKLQELLLED
ncbi:MAG TPA: phosphoribosylaminoimidazolesuccinocarboxamide synthase [Firmicutes bacterium]|nr:MAG: phosphoribosylaminoimidazole-succinocarboxamide synthase [Peptococcaceae bacterium 1109]HHT73407.1 phosphoribosylaminoimidazolesuccinocarboxamide synthase [Bacillota bacterium]